MVITFIFANQNLPNAKKDYNRFQREIFPMELNDRFDHLARPLYKYNSEIHSLTPKNIIFASALSKFALITA